MIQSTMKHSEELDREWVALIAEAYELGISSTEIKAFFKGSSPKESYVILPTTYNEEKQNMQNRPISH